MYLLKLRILIMLQILLALSLSILSFPTLSFSQTDTEYYDDEYYNEEYTDDEYYNDDYYDDEYYDQEYTDDEYYNEEYTDNTEAYNTAPIKKSVISPPTTTNKTITKNTITNATKNIIPTPIKNTNKNFYMPPYKTFDFKNLKTKKTPKLLSSEGMLKNLDQSYWLLKFYGHPDIAVYKYVELSIKDSQMNIQLLDYADTVVENNIHQLTPIKMFKPNEGVFAYPDKNGTLYFVYLNLFLPHLLAMKIASSFEEAEEMSKKSLTELGVFVLR